MGTVVKTASGRLRDAKQAIEHFFFKKFGYNWKQKMRRKEITQEQIQETKEEFEAMMKNIKDDNG